MTYKLPYKGMSRIPSGKGFTINISEDDLKSEKSASPEPPKEISYEGQGGKDYENRPEDAINPEGQGGKDYSDYEDSMSRKASALNKNDLNRKERKMVRQHMRGGNVKLRDPFTEVDPKKVLAEINKRKNK
jgi:hypothetical protein